MGIQKFEDIVVWQKSQELAVDMYTALKTCRDYGFKDQLLRAVVSISNNIAEGYERKGDKQFSHFLYIAKGSSGEVRSMLYLSVSAGILSEQKSEEFRRRAEEISRMLSGLIAKLNQS